MSTTMFYNTGIVYMQQTPIRFLLYCHDTYGLGHLRRTLSLATHFTSVLPQAEVLLVTGSPLAHNFAFPPRVDYVKLPAVTKLNSGDYAARSLAMEFSAVRDLRAAILRETALAYKPDVFLVDHAPQGMKGEAMPALVALRTMVPHCLRVLGLRDIVDDAARVRVNWMREGIYHTLEHAYDLLLVYGAQQFYDLAEEYVLPTSVAQRIRYCGYLNRVENHIAPCGQEYRAYKAWQGQEQLVVVTAGGGGDGFPLLSTYLTGLQQMEHIPFKSLLITGPLMSAEEQQHLRSQLSALPAERVRIETFVSESVALFQNADLVIAMAGYNTVVELLALRQRMLLIPRINPRWEQFERATRLAQHGLAHMLHPHELTPGYLLEHVMHGLREPRPSSAQFVEAGITFTGQQMALQYMLRDLYDLRSRLTSTETCMPSAAISAL